MSPQIIASLCAVVLCLSACAATSNRPEDASKRGRLIYAKECAQCHGLAGEGGGPASLGLGGPAPDLVGLSQRNDGFFPREFVSRFVMGSLEKDDPDAAMPEFAKQGLRHVYPDGGADGEVLEADFEALLDYLASIQN
ncbi:cytochrome c [Sulfitobacter sp. S190]|uniref:c-type cytochrome n=1 Tax=Sulfitobacter sp. S190 TaxID=2867022 RepID=UPI0021A8551A|nr:cytochrome c [Sulfitobacter sp. S190]UWR21818.1 cytochrome c [Sulfitobacter sp. S190]